MRAMRSGLVSLLLVVCLGVPSVWSARTTTAQDGRDQVDDLLSRYNLHPAFEKLGRGLSNALGGWLEVPLNLDRRYAKHNTGASFFTGLVYGLFKGAVRTGVGLYETVTFFLPYPEDFAPILPTLDYFQKGTKRQPLLGE